MTPSLLAWTTIYLNPSQNRLFGFIGAGHGQQQRVGKGRGCCQCCPGLLVRESLPSVYRVVIIETVSL